MVLLSDDDERIGLQSAVCASGQTRRACAIEKKAAIQPNTAEAVRHTARHNPEPDVSPEFARAMCLVDPNASPHVLQFLEIPYDPGTNSTLACDLSIEFEIADEVSVLYLD